MRHRLMLRTAAQVLMAADPAGAAPATDPKPPAVVDPAPVITEEEPAPAPAPVVVPKGGTEATTIVVACKLPQGLDLGNGIILNGSNHSSAANFGGYGITPNVDGALFNDWLSRHQDMAAVKRELIFSAETFSDVADRAREQSEVSSGFEKLDPEKMPAGLEEDPDAKARRAREAAGLG